jgi:predicted dehydrogenase
MSKVGPRGFASGIIGANPDRGWAAQAHIPALKSLPDDFEITALSTSRRESADAASKVFGIPLAFDNHQDLVNSADVDVVTITVKVPHHLELATAALAAGRGVYCEWSLGNGSQEAENLAALATKKGVLAVAGLQARFAPSVAYVRDLIRQGYVGEVLSTTFIGSGMGWGPTVDPDKAYLNDKKNGATMLSIAVGHAADALCYCLSEVRELSATMTVCRKSFTIGETGESRPTPFKERARAVIANFGVSDAALLDVLTGRARPAGKLPFELPSSMGAVEAQRSDVPYDSAGPLYAFGFGRRY